MSTVSDRALYGAPKSETDLRRQLVRDYDRVADALEYAQEKLRELRLDAAAPFSCGRPDLLPDIDRADLAVSKLLVWAWDAAKAASRPEGALQTAPTPAEGAKA